MNESARSKPLVAGNNFAVVKQEIDDQQEIDQKEALPFESSNATCTSALKCEYDPDCGCPQCRYNANTKVKTEEQQIKLEGNNDECNDNKVHISSTQFWTKCVKKEEEDDDCGCVECRGMEDSKQSNRQVKVRNEVNLTENDEQSAKPHSIQIEYNTNKDLDETQSTADDIGDCPTPDYVPSFFSENEDDEGEEEEEMEEKDQTDENNDDDINRPYSRRWSDRVANKPKITYTYQEELSESDNESVFDPSDDEKSEDEDTELEDNVEMHESAPRASKSKQPRENTLRKQINKKFKLRHSNDQTSDEYSSEEDTEIESEIETVPSALRTAKKPKQSVKPKSSHSSDYSTSENSSEEDGDGEPRKNKKFERRVPIVRLNCSECDETFKSAHKLHQHLKSNHQIRFYRCLVRDCAASFNLKPQITHHLRTEHSNLTNNWPCGECHLKFTNHRQLNKHSSRAHQKGHFRCTFKGCSFESRLYKSSVLNHYKTKHIEDVFQCQVKGCGMSFPEQNRLETHTQRAHTDEKKFQCELCESGYADKVTLTIHLAKVHQIGQLTQYKCTWPKCKWSSIHRANVFRHVREKHFKKGDQRAPKDFILKMMIDKNEQDKCKAIVTIRVNCLVDDCMEHFPDKRQLNLHMSKCHQIEEFHCVVRGCSASFKNKKNFAAHKKEIHHKQKIFHCGMCDFDTKVYMSLRSHVYYCHEEGHFRCAHPGCKFVSRTNRNEVSKHRFKHR